MGLAAKLDENEQPASTLAKWRQTYEQELAGVNKVIIDFAEDTKVPLIVEMAHHILESGGKRFRPILTILSAKMCGYSGDRHIKLAAAIEFIHTATLLHDDVVDESVLRRGQETANEKWGNSASVLVGDFLLSRAFQLIARDGSNKVLTILSDASATISEGEVHQLTAQNDISTGLETYLHIITAKTAKLFSAGCEVGAVVAELPEIEEKALEDYGTNLGIAFQIVDDVLDYSAKQEELGKTIGDDFREGKVTLPVILAYEKSTNDEKKFWDKAISNDEKNDEDLKAALELMAKYNVLAETMKTAREYADKAIESLSIFSDCDEKQALLDLLEFSVNREF
jgi:octaprenyl-diphosphate synthase